jgi:tRNA(Ile2) C34 agmatinyltransferase TiaS
MREIIVHFANGSVVRLSSDDLKQHSCIQKLELVIDGEVVADFFPGDPKCPECGERNESDAHNCQACHAEL